jgi:hypothetical protein
MIMTPSNPVIGWVGLTSIFQVNKNSNKIMTNTKRKSVVIEWPSTGHFTIDDMQKKYPDMVNITLRFRMKKALENSEISSIGRIKPAIGRPRLVFVKGLVTEAAQKAATAAGILPPIDSTSVGATEFNSTTTPATSKTEVVAPSTKTLVTV